ncbi:MAG: energy-coupling factor transporter transmembrane protein EcfT [Thaumarchaeota archaeon]|nr:energy-coupling factor transporter transmembrane protein EcfT [Nitrososphaerota archaeon]
MIKLKYTYVNVDSKVHNLNPIVKVLWITCVDVLAILVWDIAWLGLIFLSVFAVGLAANLGRRRLLDAMRPLKPLVIILLFSPSFILLPELRILSPNPSLITLLVEGVAYGITIALRFSCIIYSAFIFMMTTRLNDLAYMLVKLGMPYRYSFMIITSFRLIPSLEKYAENIKYAQLARGLNLDRAGILRRYFNFVKYTVKPLLISALRGSLTLAISMDSACFGAYRSRVFLNDVPYSKQDVFISAVILLIMTLSIYVIFTGRLPILFDFSETIRRLFYPSGKIV